MATRAWNSGHGWPRRATPTVVAGSALMNEAYPFADLDLARRLERAEAQGNVNFVEARARAFPDRGATWIEVGGTFAMFDGVGSPVTQTFGLGVFEPLTDDHMDKIEQFFRSRGAEVFQGDGIGRIDSGIIRWVAR